MTVPINTTESLDRSLSERLNQAIDPTSEPDVLTEACETTSGSATKPNIDPALVVSAEAIVETSVEIDAETNVDAETDAAKIDDRGVATPNTDVPVLRRAAMDFLARREHSLYELQQKLSLKFPDVDASVLRGVLDKLRGENLQSDERFTESYVRYRKSRGFAYLHIKADLTARRVSSTLIDSCLTIDDKDWTAIANRLVCKKLGESGRIEFGTKPHRKLLRFLQSRGFSNLQIRKALETKLNK